MHSHIMQLLDHASIILSLKDADMETKPKNGLCDTLAVFYIVHTLHVLVAYACDTIAFVRINLP